MRQAFRILQYEQNCNITLMFYVLCVVLVSGLFQQSKLSAQEKPIYPIDVAAAKDGTIYIADLKLPGIWELSEGKLSIYYKASKKFRTPLNAVRCITVGDDGTIYVGDSATRDVYRFDAEGKPVPLSNGKIGIASDLVIQGNEIIVSDLETQRIWSLPLQGGEPKEVAVVAGVRGLCLDADSKLVFLTTNDDQIRRVEAPGNVVVVRAERPFEFPHQITIEGDKMYVSDNYAGCLWSMPVDGSGQPEKLVADSPLVKPVGLGRLEKSILVADPHAKDVFQVEVDGQVKSLLNSAE